MMTGVEVAQGKVSPEVTDWTKCAICQMDKGDQPTRCPAKGTGPHASGYKTFVSNLQEFHDLGEVPKGVDPQRLDEGQGIEQALESNNAWWHKACYNQFDSLHLARAKKCKSEENTECCSPVKTRTITGSTKVSKSNLCFFCGEEGGKEGLHIASTKEIDSHVRKAATTLQDRILLAKLGSTDLIAQEAQYHKNCLSSLYNRERKALR